MRTYSPQDARLAELLGSSPTVIHVPEVSAGIRDRHHQRDDHLIGNRNIDQGLGVRQELLHDERFSILKMSSL
jgi:hypothetical protein